MIDEDLADEMTTFFKFEHRDVHIEFRLVDHYYRYDLNDPPAVGLVQGFIKIGEPGKYFTLRYYDIDKWIAAMETLIMFGTVLEKFQDAFNEESVREKLMSGVLLDTTLELDELDKTIMHPLPGTGLYFRVDNETKALEDLTVGELEEQLRSYSHDEMLRVVGCTLQYIGFLQNRIKDYEQAD